MSIISNIWKNALLTGTEHATDPNQKTRIIYSNRMAMFSLCTMALTLLFFLFVQLYVLALTLSVFITLLFLAFTLCQLGKFNISRFMYILTTDLAIFTFSSILGESSGFHIYLFSTLVPILTFFSAKETKMLLFAVLSIPFFWVCLELSNYNFFDMRIEVSQDLLSVMKTMNYSFVFILIIMFLYEFLMYSYANEDLLNNTIHSIQLKKQEIVDKNKQYEKTTEEFIAIQQLLSSNQEILKKEKEKAEKALKVKTDFLSNMSHEIRTPMNVIVGITDLLIELENDEEKIENLNLIKNSSNNLLVIINDILDFSRMESGKMIIETIDFDLHKKLNEIIRTFSIRTRQSQNKLTLHISNDTPTTISSDPVRITQVLMNLLSNANKFTDNGSIDLSVTSKQVSTNKSVILFEVRDTGIGVEPKALSKIFESFTQASSSTTRKFGGTGLGLPICKRIIEIMGGRIWVESNFNFGSSFFFELPINHPQPKTIASPNASLTCLINEDFEMNQMMSTKILSTINIIPEFALDLEDLREKATRKKYDFLLLDLSKDEFPITKLNELFSLHPEANILVFDNIVDKSSIRFDVRYTREQLNKKEILEFVKNSSSI